MLANQQPSQELGGDYFFDQRKKQTKVSSLVRWLEKLSGGSVSMVLQSAAAQAFILEMESSARTSGHERAPRRWPDCGLPS
jgi:hypothetical protein